MYNSWCGYWYSIGVSETGCSCSSPSFWYAVSGRSTGMGRRLSPAREKEKKEEDKEEEDEVRHGSCQCIGNLVGWLVIQGRSPEEPPVECATSGYLKVTINCEYLI